MKKHLAQGLLIAFIVTSVFVSNAFIKVTPVTASSMKNCELINLLITIGVLPANRADQARAAFNCSASDTITIATSTLTYNGNGSTGGTVPVNNGSYLFGATTTVANNTGGLVKTGYIFTGWNTRDRGEGNFYATSSVLTFSIRNITLYAAWERVLPINTYSLVYRSNDAATGTVPVNSNTFTTGATTTIVGNTGNLAKTNHIFSGWNTRDDGFGIDYASSSILTFGSSNVKLFARFTSTARPCVDYNYTGYSACVNGNQTRTVSTQSPASCVGGATPVLSRTCNTAVYKIIYNKNDAATGTAPVNSNLFSLGATTTVAANTGGLARNNHTFAGWNTKENGTGIEYAPGSVITFGSADIKLFARWARVISETEMTASTKVYTLAYNKNGATSGDAPVNTGTYRVGSTTVVVGNTGGLSKANHIFSGWNTKEDGNGTDYASGSVLTFGSSNVKLFARFTSTARPCVDYNYTGYSACVNGNQTRTVSTQSPASCVGGATPVLSRTCNTAVYKIIYNKNDAATGTAPVNSNLFSLGATTTVAANTGGLARNNHTFAGWNTKENGTGIEYAPGSVITFGSADIKLFARWARVAN